MKHIVRLATEYDAAQIQAIYEPYVASTPISFELDPPDASDMRRRIVETLVQYPWLVCESPEGAILGYAYGSQHRVRVAYQWSVDVSIYIGEQYHRMGAGSALYKSLLALLTMQGYCTAYAGITLPNDASVRLHESVCFTKVGVFKDTGYKLGEWLDVGWWELSLQTREIPVDSPRALPSVQAGTSVPVDLSGFFNIRGIQADGAKTDSGGGFDGEGNTFPSAFVAGIKQSKNVSFTLGAAGSTDAIACHANTIPLPSGMHKSLWVLGSSIEGSHKDQTITVTYTDGTTKTYHQNFSDWYVPEAFPGESRAIRSEYRITGDGSRDSRTFFVYSYGFDLIPTKTVQSITLPNDEEIRVLAISLAD